MGELADRIDRMRVRASTPDGGITAELRDRDQLSLTFREGLYPLLDDAGLGRRLAVLANLLWVARTREYWRIYGDVTGDYSIGEDPPADARAAGEAAGGLIREQFAGLAALSHRHYGDDR
jgi:hypothetical protein